MRVFQKINVIIIIVKRYILDAKEHVVQLGKVYRNQYHQIGLVNQYLIIYYI